MLRSTQRLAALVLLAAACSSDPIAGMPDTVGAPQDRVSTDRRLARATFAGGCFWCMEPPFEGVRGVYSVLAGYTGGPEKVPTYKQVASGKTGHTEAVQITFDPAAIRYEQLLDIFWRSMDPTDAGGQFADRGSQYRPGIFFHDDAQQRTAKKSLDTLGRSGRFEKPIDVEITKFDAFYPAEDYHQDYYRTNTAHYKRYRIGSGRAAFLARVWGKDGTTSVKRYVRPAKEKIRKRLDSVQFHVTQENGTERPFNNKYWANKKNGIYVDVVTGEPLFSSADKFKSGTGWPSFVRPLIAGNIVRVVDRTLGVARVEVRSKHGNSHLGHVFRDGPKPTGLRYCINSAALRFVPTAELKTEGYSEFVRAFADPTTRPSQKKQTASRPSRK